jgi:DNA-binding transcriptional LysR family regulator
VDIRFLESFLIVAQSGSIADGARRLNLTPAAVAQRIRALEAEIGARLIARAGRTVRPTEAGQAILQRAAQLLRDARELRIMAAADSHAGALRIGAVSTAVTGVVPGILKRLADRYPQLDIYVMPGTSIDLYQKVLQGDLDAAIVVEPPFELLKACDWALLRSEPLIVIAPAAMDISNPRVLLQTQPFIRYDRNHWGGRLADSYLRHAKITPSEKLELDALDAIAVMVASGLGVSLVPDWAPPWPEGLRLNKIAIGAAAFDRRIGLLWMRNSTNIRLVNLLVEQTRAALAGESEPYLLLS